MPGKPRTLLLTTGGRCDLDPERLLEVFGDQRRRLIADLRGFGPDDWAAPTRSAEWSAHDMVRHLCDGTSAFAAGPDDRTFDWTAGFDPRTTPREWLAESDGESADATLDRLAAITEEALTSARERLALGARFDVRLLSGPMDWTVQALHIFWDSWIHERDVFLARGVDRRTDADATAYATAYGLFLAGTVAGKFRDRLRESIVLGGDGGGVFKLDTHGPVTLTVTRTATAGPPAAEFADALAGRGPATVLDGLPAGTRIPLTRLADFFNTPPSRSHRADGARLDGASGVATTRPSASEAPADTSVSARNAPSRLFPAAVDRG
jgi:uncharacterized protein (TIGR03083 family)